MSINKRYVIEVEVLSPIIAPVIFLPELIATELIRKYEEKIKAIFSAIIRVPEEEEEVTKKYKRKRAGVSKRIEEETSEIFKKREKRIKEYAERILHIDRAFRRVHCPIHNTYEVCVLGSAVRGALNARIPELRGKPVRVYGMFFNEFNVDIDGSKIIKPDGTSLLTIFEYIMPRARGHIIIEAGEREIELIKKVNEIVVGGRKNKGFGRVKILEVREVNTY